MHLKSHWISFKSWRKFKKRRRQNCRMLEWHCEEYVSWRIPRVSKPGFEQNLWTLNYFYYILFLLTRLVDFNTQWSPLRASHHDLGPRSLPRNFGNYQKITSACIQPLKNLIATCLLDKTDWCLFSHIWFYFNLDFCFHFYFAVSWTRPCWNSRPK